MPQDFDDKIDHNIAEFRAQEEEALANVLATSKYGIPYVDLSATAIQNEALRLITEEEARRIKVAPFKIAGKEASVAILDPSSDEVMAYFEELERKGWRPLPYMASPASLERAWARYKEISFAQESRRGGLDVSGATLEDLAKEIKSLSDVKRIVDEITTGHETHATSRLLEVILAGAISLQCSDVHIEPEETRTRVRFRLDGVLQDILFLDPKLYHLLNSRIKLIAGLKLTIVTRAQDGRFSIFENGTEISMRTSTIPGSYGVFSIQNPFR